MKRPAGRPAGGPLSFVVGVEVFALRPWAKALLPAKPIRDPLRLLHKFGEEGLLRRALVDAGAIVAVALLLLRRVGVEDLLVLGAAGLIFLEEGVGLLLRFLPHRVAGSDRLEFLGLLFGDIDLPVLADRDDDLLIGVGADILRPAAKQGGGEGRALGLRYRQSGGLAEGRVLADGGGDEIVVRQRLVDRGRRLALFLPPVFPGEPFRRETVRRHIDLRTLVALHEAEPVEAAGAHFIVGEALEADLALGRVRLDREVADDGLVASAFQRELRKMISRFRSGTSNGLRTRSRR